MCSRFMTGSFSKTARRKTPCIPDRLSAALLGGKRPFGHVIPKMPGNSVPVSFRCEAVLDGGMEKFEVSEIDMGEKQTAISVTVGYFLKFNPLIS